MSTEQEIRDGERLAQFLADPAVVAAFERLRARYYDRFKASIEPNDWRMEWARSRVLDDLTVELQAAIDTGARANADKQRRERAVVTNRPR